MRPSNRGWAPIAPSVSPLALSSLRNDYRAGPPHGSLDLGPACFHGLTVKGCARSFSTSVALAQKVRSAPHDSTILLNDERIGDGCGLPQPKSSPDRDFVVGVEFGVNEYRTSGIIRSWPHRLVSVNESDGAKLGALLPSSHEFLAGQFRNPW